ncbi:hypothetical protein DL770_007630 [Monosporascus sp. CRB-9-2]|nr:hypothetical protein DL770_007630 [Monosporascus sp. CRB-9-2]
MIGAGPLNEAGNKPFECSHSDERHAPPCSDCSEQCRVGFGVVTDASRPLPESLGPAKVKQGWAAGMGRPMERSHLIPEVYHPEPELELDGAPHTRKSQPGLEVALGPPVVTSAEIESTIRSGAAYRNDRNMSDERGVVAGTRRRKMICGIQRRLVFLSLALALLVAVAAVTVGVVLGLKDDEGSGGTSGAVSPPPEHSNNINSSSSNSPKPTQIATSDSRLECPEADGTVFTDQGTGKRFKHSCYEQYPGYDIENREKESMAACITWCAEVDECVAANWYNAGPQGTDLNYCWLKSDRGEVRKTEDAQNAALID